MPCFTFIQLTSDEVNSLPLSCSSSPERNAKLIGIRLIPMVSEAQHGGRQPKLEEKKFQQRAQMTPSDIHFPTHRLLQVLGTAEMKGIQTLVSQQKAEPVGIRSSFIVTHIKHHRSTARLGALLLDKARKHTFPCSPGSHI